MILKNAPPSTFYFLDHPENIREFIPVSNFITLVRTNSNEGSLCCEQVTETKMEVHCVSDINDATSVPPCVQE